ncbi:hypothetical protein LEP1GSC151_0783 [Leptospira interrogans serovar Grippotyphosa str. LT2186]|uniref:Uncharacterized protein n=1 Tax=Leptospira interrogans serovar Grippotyphosa str. LT2186 TaxID=1001599 RepID=M3GPN5_LEPIR|nr:hypothetical protein LEP1GSC151_0783 [Leptospira interrogans serovar Grippotyphosa str. LT2186]
MWGIYIQIYRFLIVQAPALGVGKFAFKSCSLLKRRNLWELLQIWV